MEGPLKIVPVRATSNSLAAGEFVPVLRTEDLVPACAGIGTGSNLVLTQISP